MRALRGHAYFIEPVGRAGMSLRWLWLPVLAILAVGVAGLADSCGPQAVPATPRVVGFQR